MPAHYCPRNPCPICGRNIQFLPAAAAAGAATYSFITTSEPYGKPYHQKRCPGAEAALAGECVCLSVEELDQEYFEALQKANDRAERKSQERDEMALKLGITASKNGILLAALRRLIEADEPDWDAAYEAAKQTIEKVIK
jgi:hypothetical protein